MLKNERNIIIYHAQLVTICDLHGRSVSSLKDSSERLMVVDGSQPVNVSYARGELCVASAISAASMTSLASVRGFEASSL